mgnify:CR=1 FL=1
MTPKTQIIQQMQAIGQETYEIGMMKRENNRTLHLSDERNVYEMIDLLYKYSQRNDEKSKENIYIRPLPDIEHNVIFLDDLTPAALNYLKEKGILPACVVQTSEKSGVPSLHAWYKLPENVDRPTRKAVEYRILTDLHERFPDPDPKKCPGDFGSCDGGHYGRLAGFHNHGLTSPRDNPVSLIESTGHTLSSDVAQRLLTEAAPFIDRNPTPKNFEALETIWQRPYENNKTVQYVKENILPKVDSSRPPYQQDFFICMYLLRKGFSEADTKKALLELSPHTINEDRKRNPAYYIDLTLSKARQALDQDPPPIPSRGAACASAFSSSAPAGASAPATGSDTNTNAQTQPPASKPRLTLPAVNRRKMGVKPRHSAFSPKP